MTMRCSGFLVVALLLGAPAAHAQDLMVGNVATRVHTIAYELPGVPPDMVRVLAGALKQKFPQAEVIDAAAAGENELREKLKKTFFWSRSSTPACASCLSWRSRCL
jgi:hypothetical protein